MDTIKEALTFDDVLLLPKYSNILPSNTDISLNLTSKISLRVPFFTSAMDNLASFSDFQEDDSYMMIFPNPANQLLTVQTDLVGIVEVFDIHGRYIISDEISEERIFNTQLWENGIYLIQFSSQNGMTEVKKIIIQH